MDPEISYRVRLGNFFIAPFVFRISTTTTRFASHGWSTFSSGDADVAGALSHQSQTKRSFTNFQTKDSSNGKDVNTGEVGAHNRKVNEEIGSSKPPVDGTGKNRPQKDDLPDAPEKKKVSVRENATFSWQDVGNWGYTASADKSKTFKLLREVESYVIDHFYGDWWWNSSLMVGTCFFSWLVARLGGGILSLVMVLLFTNSVYRLEFRRFNRDVRDDMTRVNAVNKLEKELESMKWLNSFLDKFWVIYMPALSEQVLFIANEILKDQAPGFGIEKLSLEEFTLGSKAPRIESVKSYPKKGDDHIEMDWAFSFAPNDTDDMTKNEIVKKINPKVALGVTVGKAFISKSLPILVEDMALTGRMNIKLKLSPNFPHVKMVSVQFLEPPNIDYALKPVGGDTLGLDIMSFIPGLSKFVNSLIHANLRPMLYAPNSLDIDVEELIAQQSNDSTGCLVVSIKRCTRLKTGQSTKPNSINPYVQLKIQSNPAVDEKTKVKKAVNDPVFLEEKFILVNKLEGNFLNFNVYHLLEDQMNDQLIGTVAVPLTDLLQKDTQLGVVKNIVESGKAVGKIEFDLRYSPSIPPVVLEDGTKEDNIDHDVGILKLTLHSALDLDLSKSVLGVLNPYAEIYINNDLKKVCRKLKKTNEPSWNESFESLISQQSETRILIFIKGSANDDVVAKLEANLQDLVFETSRGNEWLTLKPLHPGGPFTRVKITAQWKALALSESTQVASHFNAPIGGIRLHLRQAKDLKNLESVGEVDPYVRVIVNGKVRARTVTIAESVSPVFDSVFFFPVNNAHEHLLLEIMDAEPENKDRSLGSCAISVNELIKRNEKGEYLAYDGSKEVISQPVLFDKENHGELFYSVSFAPTIPALTYPQKANPKEYQRYLKSKEDSKREKQERDQKLFEKHPDEYEWIEVEEEDLKEPERVNMSLDDAVKYRAGVLTVVILEGRLEKTDLYVHTLFDDQAVPSGSTPKNDTRSFHFMSRAEAFIRDLPNSKLIFRIAKKNQVLTDKDVVIEKIFGTLDILKKSYEQPIDLKIGEKNILKIRLDFIPSHVKLNPLDTVLDVGYFRLDILKAEGLNSVDKNGKSDPFVVLKLDGVEIFKTDKKRKTLDPVWNEEVEFPVLSRSRQIILLDVYDWDLTHDRELLGRVNLDLSTIPPHESTPFTVELDTGGLVYLRAVFKPEYVRPKLNTSSGLPIDLGAVSGVPMKALGTVGNSGKDIVGGGVGLASDGLTKSSQFLKGFGNRKRKKADKGNTDDESDTATNGDATSNGASKETESNPGLEPTQEEKEVAAEQGKDSSDTTSKSQYANDLQSLRSGSHPPPAPGALPNIHNETLPPPQKPFGHQRNTSEVSNQDSADTSFGSSILGVGAVAGRLHIMSAKGYGEKGLDVKVSLKSTTKEKSLFKTRSTKPDKTTGEYKWSESVPFKATPESHLILTVRESHTFGKKVEVEKFDILLQDVLDQQNDVTYDGNGGSITFNVKYLST